MEVMLLSGDFTRSCNTVLPDTVLSSLCGTSVALPEITTPAINLRTPGSASAHSQSTLQLTSCPKRTHTCPWSVMTLMAMKEDELMGYVNDAPR